MRPPRCIPTPMPRRSSTESRCLGMRWASHMPSVVWPTHDDSRRCDTGQSLTLLNQVPSREEPRRLNLKEVPAHLLLILEGAPGGGSVDSPIELSDSLAECCWACCFASSRGSNQTVSTSKATSAMTWAGQSCGKYKPRDMGPRPPTGFGARFVFTWTVVADRSPGA